MPEVMKVDPENPDQSTITEAIQIIRSGGVIAYPTETFYGLGVDGFNEKAIEKIFFIKGRDIKTAISVIIGEIDDLRGLVRDIPKGASHLMNTFWPGPLTLLFSASENIPSLLSANTGKIGIRISSHPVATALAKTYRRPITSTSANLSGARECTSSEEVITCIGDRIDAVIDGGPTPGRSGSTIVDITTSPPTILREGVIPGSLILYSLQNR
ncbi:MAG TPA: threonylcarbamoyl-AMP synthase [Syntrophaceae bacterium]|jgi:L-threonylcarbamoyladenylate synthase|nr:threonylcarbamoyl-AMP synthase [Syntrophaceae bacterium]